MKYIDSNLNDKFDDPWYRFERAFDLIDKHGGIAVDSKWLDLGCQIGQLLKLAGRRQKIAAFGIDDYQAENVALIAKKHLALDIERDDQIFDGTWTYVERRLERNGIDLEISFDVITALEILEHMVDTDMFLADIRAHLATGGRLVISTPNINSLRNRLFVPLGVYPAGLEYRTVVHHVRLYNLAMLVNHVESHGFKCIEVVGEKILPRRWLSMAPRFDRVISDLYPSLSSTLIAIFRAV